MAFVDNRPLFTHCLFSLGFFLVACVAQNHGQSTITMQKKAVNDFNMMLESIVNAEGLFDQYGSIDAAVWKKDESGQLVPIYQGAFGMAQYEHAIDYLGNISGTTPSPQLKIVVDKYLASHPDVPALNSSEKRNLYRIASNTKSVISVAAFLMHKNYGLQLDDKVKFKYDTVSYFCYNISELTEKPVKNG